MNKELQLTFPSFDETEIDAVRQCLDSKWVTQGPMVKAFEQAVAKAHQLPHALATTSCTAALHLAALALGLGPGDEVIVPAFTWVTSAHSAEYVGAKAVLCDIDLNTFNIDPVALEAAITPRTKAVVVVHLFGLAAPMKEILAITKPRGIKVIEDAACAIGTRYAGKPIGAMGDLGCFSFHPRKVVTTGEGGAVTTADDKLATLVASFRNHGASPDPAHANVPFRPWHMARFDRIGFNLRLSDIQAAVGVAQMKKLDALLAERQHRAMRYQELLSTIPALVRPSTPPDCGHTYQSYVVRVPAGNALRNKIMERLQAANIQSRPGTHAVHRLGYYKDRYGYQAGDFPRAVEAEDTTITLPIFPGMTDADQDLVVATLKGAL